MNAGEIEDFRKQVEETRAALGKAVDGRSTSVIMGALLDLLQSVVEQSYSNLEKQGKTGQIRLLTRQVRLIGETLVKQSNIVAEGLPKQPS